MITEAALRAAAEGSCKRYVTGLTAGYDPSLRHPVSPAFEKRIRSLKRRADHPILWLTARRTAAALLALLLAGFLWLAVDREARAAFTGWVGELKDFYYALHRDAEPDFVAKDADFRPGWIPEGYAEASTKTVQQKTTVIYANKEGKRLRFSYIQGADEADWIIDTTQCEVLDAWVGGEPAQVFRALSVDTANALIWTDSEQRAFFLSGFVSEDDLIRMAESVQITP